MHRLEVQWEGQVDGELSSGVVSAENYGCCVSLQTSQTADDQHSDFDHITSNGRLGESSPTRQIVDSCSLFFLKHFIHLTWRSLTTFSPIPNFATCCSREVEVSLQGKASESCLGGSSR